MRDLQVKYIEDVSFEEVQNLIDEFDSDEFDSLIGAIHQETSNEVKKVECREIISDSLLRRPFEKVK